MLGLYTICHIVMFLSVKTKPAITPDPTTAIPISPKPRTLIPTTPIPTTFIQQTPPITLGPPSLEFPIEEFLKDQVLPPQYINLCGRTTERRGNERQKSPERCCECTEDCMKYGTCCIDKLWNESGGYLHDYLKTFISQKTQRYKTLSCQNLLPKTLENFETDTYYMVASCLRNTNNATISRQCKNINNLSNMMPVLGGDGYIYRNMFCAQCNNVDRFSHVKLEFKCVNSENIKGKQNVNLLDIQKLKECIIKPASEFKRSMKVCTHRNEECQPGNENYDLCQAYSGPLLSGRYQNYHCWKCSHGNSTNKDIFRLPNCPPKLTCEPDCILPKGKEYSKYVYTFTMNADQKSLSNNNVIIQNYQQQFPIREFLNISNDYKFPLDKGLDQYLCTSPVRKKCCSCQNTCIEKRKCCIDVFWNKVNPPVSLDSYVNLVRNKFRTYFKGRSCEYVYPYPRHNQKSKTYLMVKSCPNNVNKEIDTKCRNSIPTLSNNIPVYDQSRVLYANFYCARCNGVTNFTFTSLKLTCNNFNTDGKQKNATELANELRKSSCTYSLDADNTKFVLKECARTPRENYCSPSNKNYELCYSYFGRINGFESYHCLKCSNSNSGRSTTIDLNTLNYCDRVAPTHPGTRSTTPGLGGRGVWSMLINPTNIYIGNYKENWEFKCSENQTLDLELSICVAKRDSKQPVLKNTVDRKIISISIENATFEKCALARGSKLFIILQNNITNMIEEHIIKQFQEMVFANATFNVRTNNSLYNTNNTNQSVTILELNEPITINLLDNLTKALNISKSPLWNSTLNYVVSLASIAVPNVLYSFQPERYFPRGRICHHYERLNNNTNVSFDDNCNVLLAGENETIFNDNISMWIDVRQSTKGIARCKQFHLQKPCSYTKLLRADNITLDTTSYNITLHIDEDQTITYTPEDYQPTADGYVVCITTSTVIKYRTFSGNRDLSTLSRIEEKISLVGTCLSIVCYIWIISTYLIFDDLRTLPGYSYTFMCLYLLLADCLFIASANIPLNTNACISLAVLLHWSLFGSFMWTIVIAFDLVSKFGSFSKHSRRDHIKQIKQRFFITFSLITLYIAILIALDQSSVVNIQYGRPLCWINNVYARLGFYIIPTALISVFTFMVLLYTTIKIYTEQKVNERVLKTQRKSNLLRIALKLTVILGVTELIGYVNTGTSNPKENEEIFNAAFRFTYSVLRSLRGVMLWLVLILGANMIKKYKKQYNRMVQKSEGHTETTLTNLRDESENRNHTSQV